MERTLKNYEEAIKICEKHYLAVGRTTIKHFDKFDIQALDEIKRVRTWDANIDIEQWREAMNTTVPSNNAVSIALVRNENCPPDVILEQLVNLDIFLSHDFIDTVLHRKDVDLYLDALCEHYNATVRHCMGITMTDGRTGTVKYVKNFPDEMIEKVAKVMERHDESAYVELFMFISNDEMAEYALNKEYARGRYAEEIKHIICNNSTLSEKVRNSAFDEGPDWREIHNPTSYMLAEMYGNTTRTLFEMTVEEFPDKRTAERAKEMSTNLLCRLTYSPLFNEIFQYDYVLKLASVRKRAADKVLGTFIKTTSHIPTLMIIKDMPSADAITVYQNPNMPADEIVAKAESYCDKINRHKGTSFPDVWKDYLALYIQRATLSDKCYETILEIGSPSLNRALCSHLTTPPHILKKLIEKTEAILSDAEEQYQKEDAEFNPDEHSNRFVTPHHKVKYITTKDQCLVQMMCAKINIECQERGLDKERAKALINTMSSPVNSYSTSPAIQSHERNNMLKLNDENGNREECVDIIRHVLTTAQDNQTKPLKRFLYIDEYVKREAIKREETGIPLSEEARYDLREFLANTFKDTAYDTSWLALDEHLEKIIELHETYEKATAYAKNEMPKFMENSEYAFPTQEVKQDER